MTTPIRISPSSLREGRWYEYVIRFALGGAATVFTGIISSRYGASVGGLFLALPAIFCASATLIEKHEIRRARSGSQRRTARTGSRSTRRRRHGPRRPWNARLRRSVLVVGRAQRRRRLRCSLAGLDSRLGGGLVRSAEAEICPAGCPGDERLCDAAKTLVLMMGPDSASQASLPAIPARQTSKHPFDAESLSAGHASREGVRAPGGIKLRNQLTLSADQVRLCS